MASKKQEKIEKQIESEIQTKESQEMDRREEMKSGWQPKTELGRAVKNDEITDIDTILDQGKRILETEIVDILLPNLQTEIVKVGQSKGKFGGGKRSIWKQTQKKTKEGNKPKFATLAIVGTKDGYVGIGYGKAKETVPAREKAIRRAKLNLIKIRRGCGSWACNCGTPHSIPLKVSGRCGSVRINLMPAPRGTRLASEKEVQLLLDLAGFSDIHSKTHGQTKTKINLIKATFDALKKLGKVKMQSAFVKQAGLIEGRKA